MFKHTSVVLAFSAFMFITVQLALADQAHTEQKPPAQTAEHNHSTVNLHRFIHPSGITTLSFLFATLIIGLNVHRNRKALLPLHKILAITTACLALVHLSLILLS